MTAAGVTSLGVATAALASGDQNIGQAFQTLLNPTLNYLYLSVQVKEELVSSTGYHTVSI